MLWLHRGLAVSDKSFTHFLLPQFSSSFLQVGRIPTSCSVFSRPHQMSRTVLTPQAPMGWLLIKVNALVICHGSISAMWCVQHFAGYEDGTGTSCWVPEIYSFFFFNLAVLSLCCDAQGLHCCTWGFSSCSEQGLLSSCSGFSCLGTQALRHMGIWTMGMCRVHRRGAGNRTLGTREVWQVGREPL